MLMLNERPKRSCAQVVPREVLLHYLPNISPGSLLNWQQSGSAEGLFAETGESNGPWITSTCQCSSCVAKRQVRIFLIPRCRV
jgi:hypothetical protein